MIRAALAWAFILSLLGCGTTYRSDLGFLKSRTETIVLGERERDARVLLCPELGGRVMSSSATGEGGLSYGWFLPEAIEAPDGRPTRLIGGEDLLRLSFQAPESEREPYNVHASEPEVVKMRRDFRLRDASGFTFDLRVERDVRLVREEKAWRLLQMPAEPELRMVAYETINVVRNTGPAPWPAERGFGMKIIGAFPADPRAVVVLPLRDGPGPAVEGSAPPDRLYARPGAAFFRVDGLQRSRVAVRPERIRPILGCWSPERGVLTLIQHTASSAAAENDGPAEPDAPVLGLYQLELASPPLALAPGKSATLLRRTIHVQGPRAGLDALARRQLGAGLDEIEAAPLR